MPTGRHSETILGYCDKTDIENFLLLDIDSSFDDQINSWIAVAEKWANNYMGYTTASGVLREAIIDETAISQVDSDSNLIIFPRKTPIVSVSVIDLIKGTDVISLSLETGDNNARYNIPTSADYILYPDYELSITGSSVISSFGDIRFTKFFSRIDYIGGYAEVPYDIRMAAINLASDIIMRHSNKEGLEAITQGRVSKRWYQRGSWGITGDRGESDFVKDAKVLLTPYRMVARWI